MGLRDFMVAIGYLPATIGSGIVSMVFGATQTDDEDNVVLNEKTGEPEAVPSLLGLILDSIKAFGQAIGDFIASHKKAMATAAWLTLTLAGATALTLFLLPASALAAVAAFSIANVSILSLVGTNTMLQIAAASGLVGAAASTAVYLVAAVVNTISWIKDCFNRPTKGKESDPADLLDDENSSDDDYGDDSNVKMTSMMPKQHDTVMRRVTRPHDSVAPLAKKTAAANPDEEFTDSKGAKYA